MKALVVDDSRAMRVILSRLLQNLGFEVAQARHGREGLTYLTSHPDVELALVDWNMPEMNGLELVTTLRQDNQFDELRIVMVTTETEMSQVARAIEAGASEYVMKPFTEAIIAEKLRLLDLEPLTDKVA
jgi:two-component system chemotaxis response regulator CheY